MRAAPGFTYGSSGMSWISSREALDTLVHNAIIYIYQSIGVVVYTTSFIYTVGPEFEGRQERVGGNSKIKWRCVDNLKVILLVPPVVLLFIT